MTSMIERRLQKLENAAAAQGGSLTPYMIFPKDGESHDAAIVRAGHDPEDPKKLFLMIVPVQPTKGDRSAT